MSWNIGRATGILQVECDQMRFSECTAELKGLGQASAQLRSEVGQGISPNGIAGLVGYRFLVVLSGFKHC